MSELSREYYGDGRISNKTAQIVGPVIDRLLQEKGGEVTALDLLKEAQRESSPLKEFITWNDRDAANQWRLEECRGLVQGTKLILRDLNGNAVYDGPVALNVTTLPLPPPVEFEGREYRLRPYVEVLRIKESKDLTERVLEDAVMDLLAFKKRFTELQKVLKAKFKTTKKVETALAQFEDEVNAVKAKPQKAAA